MTVRFLELMSGIEAEASSILLTMPGAKSESRTTGTKRSRGKFDALRVRLSAASVMLLKRSPKNS